MAPASHIALFNLMIEKSPKPPPFSALKQAPSSERWVIDGESPGVNQGFCDSAWHWIDSIRKFSYCPVDMEWEAKWDLCLRCSENAFTRTGTIIP